MKTLRNGPVPWLYTLSARKFFKAPVIALAFFVILGSVLPQQLLAFGTDQFRPDERGSVTKAQYSFTPEPISGAATYSLPIAIPPGRNLMAPALALEYSSQNIEDIGQFGYGWSMSIPYIERINRYGSEKLYSKFDFFSSLDGEIASTSSSTLYRAKSDSGSFREYVYQSNGSWLMRDKDGKTYKFGTSTLSRVDNVASSTQVFRWMVDEIRDLNGNYVKFEYAKDGGQIYPSRVVYTGNGSTDGSFEVAFTKSLRTDIATSSRSAFTVVSKYLITEIQAKISGSWVRKYEITYKTGDNGQRSLLGTVTESGQGDSGTVTLPATLFSYTASSSPGWSYDSTWDPPVPFSNGSDQGFRLADVNGDGLIDILHSNNPSGGSPVNEVYINDGTGWNVDSNWSLPIYLGQTGGDTGARVADVNADGYADLISAKEPTLQVYLNNATTTGWSLATSTVWSFPEYVTNGVADFGVRIADVNGDSLPDVIRKWDGSPSVSKIYINTGSNWALDPAWGIPCSISNSGNDGATAFVDINGDGLSDCVESFPYGVDSYTNSYLNNGDGSWTFINAWDPPSYFVDSSYRDQGVRFSDVNGDGLVDYLHSQNVGQTPPVFSNINTGNGWVEQSTWDVPEYFMWGYVDNGGRMVDVDGDGMDDMLVSKDVGGTSYGKTYINKNERADLLYNVLSPAGGTVTIGYKTPQLYRDGSQVALNPKFPFVMPTLHELAKNDSFGLVGTTTYRYEGGTFYYASPFDKRIAGFSLIAETDPLGFVKKTYYHQGNTTDSAKGEYADSIYKLGRSYRFEKESTTGAQYDVLVSKWDEVLISGISKFVKLVQSVTLSYDGNTTHKDKAEAYGYDNSTGSLVTVTQYGEVTASSDGTYSDVTGDTRTRSYTYGTSTTSAIKPLATEVVVDNGSVKVRETRNYYDNQSLGTVTLGNLTKVEQWITGSTYASSTYAYNNYGLPTQIRDPRSKLTTFAYDGFNLYPATTTNPLGHAVFQVFDYSLGKANRTVDANSRAFETSFDGLDRRLAEKQPDILSPSTLVTVKSYTYTDTRGQKRVLETQSLDASTDSLTYTYFDGFDRKIQVRKEAEHDGNYSTFDYIYDAAGNLLKESQPYFSFGTSKTSPTGNSNLYTVYSYDAMGRVATTTTSVGVTAQVYDQWVTTVVDALSNVKGYVYDAFGRLIQVNENNDGSQYATQYVYSAADNLTKITDADGNVRNFTYDGLSRRLTAQDLHDAADGTFGTWGYVYDVASNLASTTDPKSQIVNYTYDDLNRITSEDYTGQSGTEVLYGYDTCSDGIGRLCVATSTGAVTKFAYNALGLVASEQKTISGTVLTTMNSYDRRKDLAGIVHPDGSEVKYTRNASGLLERIEYKDAGGSFQNVLSAIDYAPTEAITTKFYGNGAQTTYTFDPDAQYRLTRIFTVASSTGGGGGGFAFADELLQLFARAVELPFARRGTVDDLFDLDEPVVEVVPDVNDTDVPKISSAITDSLDDSTTTATSTETEQNVVLDPIVEPLGVTLDDVNTQVEGELTQIVEIDTATSTPTDEEKKAKRLIERLMEATDSEKIKVKAKEIAKIGKIEKAQRTDYIIDVLSIIEKDYGVEVFARVWNKDGSQVGFGPTGEVDVERFVIVNPPVLVEDKKGDVTRDVEDKAGGKVITFTFREDPHEAVLQVIEQALGQKRQKFSSEKIVSGKIGNTTTIVYPSAGASAPVDGMVRFDPSATGDTWANARSDAGDSANVTDSAMSVRLRGATVTNQWRTLDRSISGFDTSSITDTDQIDSATVSVYGLFKNNTGSYGGLSVVIDSTLPASSSTLAASDFNISQWDSVRQSDSEISFASWSTSGYNEFSLNATGTSNINKTGATWVGWRTDADLDNTEPTWENNVESDAGFYAADQAGTTNDPKLVVEHSAPNEAPIAPTGLETEGQTNPVDLSDPTPEFSAIYNDSNAGDVATDYRLQVSISSSFAAVYWDSTKTVLSSSTPQGWRSPLISYAGSALASSTTYYWRVKFWDSDNAEGVWSTATSTFTLATGGAQSAGGEILQNITLSYDAVGNILQIGETAGTGLARTVLYGYDDLYRLLTASTTVASSSPFSHTYTYSKLGNLTSKTGLGAYTYAETNYANPHAVTSINGQTLTYDNNGNLLSYASSTYAWDYRNRLSTSTLSNATTTYAYDHTTQRVKKGSTFYPNKYYNVVSATSTKHIFLPEAGLVATVQTVSSGGSGDSGYKTTGTVSVSTGWSNLTTTRLNTSDNSRASCNSTCDNSDDAQLSNFAFGVPAGATINGIEVVAEMAEAASSGNIGTEFSLSWNNGTNFTTAKSVTVDGTTDTNYTAGGAADTWGSTWSTSELADGTFRVRLNKLDSSDTLNVDYLRVRVYYTTTGGATSKVQYIHPDHLGGTNITTDANSVVSEAVDYYPYGTQRIRTGTQNDQRKFTGHEYDVESDITYANARYLEQDIGKFISQDPVFWFNQSLVGPQSLNSYSYAVGNPIAKTDPTGLAVSDYQPYLPSGSGYKVGERMGSYLGTLVLSRGSGTSAEAPNSVQCVALVAEFSRNHFGVSVSGGSASALTYTANSGSLSTYNNGGMTMPQENDIITWSGGKHGHVGIVAQVQFDPVSKQGYVYTVEQNWGTPNNTGLFAQSLTENRDSTYTVGSRSDSYSVSGWTRYTAEGQNQTQAYTTIPATPAPKPALRNAAP